MARRMDWDKVNRENLLKRRTAAAKRSSQSSRGRATKSRQRYTPPLSDDVKFWGRRVEIEGRLFGREGEAISRDDGSTEYRASTLIEYAASSNGVTGAIREWSLPLRGYDENEAAQRAASAFEAWDVEFLGGIWATPPGETGKDPSDTGDTAEAEKMNDRGWHLISTAGPKSVAERLFSEVLNMTRPTSEQHDRALLGLEALRVGPQQALDDAPEQTRRRNGWTRSGE